MNVAFYATKIQAQVMREREQFEDAYDRFPEPPLFWCMIDLVASSNYRIVHGPKLGYVRGETFFAIINNAIESCAEVRLLKEIGDAVLLMSASFRPLFEVTILADQIARQLAPLAGTTRFPFALRAGIGFGAAKRLTRRHEDYLGTSIDQLARLMTIRSATSNVILHEDVYRTARATIEEYSSFAKIGAPQMLSQERAKGMVEAISYREVVVEAAALCEFREHFVYWRS